jgi:uncharacterized Zn finger protein (UPF0148 family)
MTPLDDAAAAEANRLYWETDDSVSEIAERLEISRRALYEAVEPLPTDTPCPVCGGPLVFENRSARTGGQASCPICAETGATETEGPPPAPQLLDETHERTFLVGGAALAGAAIGALMTFALVSRR